MNVASIPLAEIVLTSLLVMILVVEITVVGAMLTSLTPTVLLERDALISVIPHGIAVINTTLTNVVLDGNVTKNLDNVNQTWLVKVMEVTLPALNTATRTHQNQTNSDAIPQLIPVTSAHRMTPVVVIKIRPRLVRDVRPHQRVSGSATRLTQNNQNVKSAKEPVKLIQIARADNKLAKTAILLKRCSNVIRRNSYVVKLHQDRSKLHVMPVVVISLQLNFLVYGED